MQKPKPFIIAGAYMGYKKIPYKKDKKRQKIP